MFSHHQPMYTHAHTLKRQSIKVRINQQKLIIKGRQLSTGLEGKPA